MSFVLVGAVAAHAQAPAPSASGGAQYQAPAPVVNLTVPGTVAKLMPDGTAAAPAGAPAEVQNAIWAANQIQDKPYIYGGGHKDFKDDGYDCSGSVSYMLHGGGLLDTPMDSSDFMTWGEAGAGAWITVYTNPGHAFAIIAGLRLDTSAAGVTAATVKSAGYQKALERGPRWRPTLRSTRGFHKRHPVGF